MPTVRQSEQLTIVLVSQGDVTEAYQQGCSLGQKKQHQFIWLTQANTIFAKHLGYMKNDAVAYKSNTTFGSATHNTISCSANRGI